MQTIEETCISKAVVCKPLQQGYISVKETLAFKK